MEKKLKDNRAQRKTEIKALKVIVESSGSFSEETQNALKKLLDNSQKAWNTSSWQGIPLPSYVRGGTISITPRTRKNYPEAEVLEQLVAIWEIGIGAKHYDACDIVSHLLNLVLPKSSGETWETLNLYNQTSSRKGRSIGIRERIKSEKHQHKEKNLAEEDRAFNLPPLKEAMENVCSHLRAALNIYPK